jgi:hypothetical protein
MKLKMCKLFLNNSFVNTPDFTNIFQYVEIEGRKYTMNCIKYWLTFAIFISGNSSISDNPAGHYLFSFLLLSSLSVFNHHRLRADIIIVLRQALSEFVNS